jgi:predicted DNA-binding protein YlxM (UPF0122 family)
MRKLTCFFMLSIMFTLACSSDVEDFITASIKWIMGNAEALDLYKQEQVLHEYFTNIIENVTCAKEIDQRFKNVTQQAADEWDADKSRIGPISTNLLSNIFPSIFVKFERCANPDAFNKDENNFDTATGQIMSQYPFISKKYDSFSDEIGFLTKGQLPQNDTCIQKGADFIELHRLSGIAQFTKKGDIYAIVAKIVYVKTSDFTKRAQRCLTGPDFSKFNSTLGWYFKQNPAQKALYDQLDDQISSLTKILPHDDQCVKEISNKLAAHLADAYASFGNGSSTISELAGEFLYVFLPKSIEEAKNCLTL